MSAWEEFFERKGVARVSRHATVITAILLGERWFRLLTPDDGTLVSIFLISLEDLVLVCAIGIVSIIFVVGLFRELKAFWRSNGNAAVLLGL